MKENTCKIMTDRKQIAILEDRLLAQYKGMIDERSQIHDWEWENDFDFTILGLMELYSSDIGGLASQIATRGSVINPKGALKVLSESRLFDEEYFTEWYFSPDNNYVKVKKYIEDLNYLRLLAHEYMTIYQNGASSTTDSAPIPPIHSTSPL